MTVVFGGQYIAATSDLICSFDPMINQLTERERETSDEWKKRLKEPPNMFGF